MKKLLLIVAITTTALTVFGQSEKDQLRKKMVADHAAGNLEQAIESADKIIKLERKSSQGLGPLRLALLNAARLYRDRMIELRQEAVLKGLLVRERTDLMRKAAENASQSEAYYSEAISLPQAAAASENGPISEATAELAWLTHNFSPQDETPTVAEGRSRIDKAESLYRDALKLSEASYGADAKETMLVVLSFANFYQKFDNYEKSMALYERYIASAERAKSDKRADLPNALRPYAQVLHASFQETESAAALKRIEEITGKKEDLPLGKLGLHLRSKDSVAFHVKASEKARAMMKYAESSSTTRRPRIVNVVVQVTVDESGKVIEVDAKTDDSDLKKRAEQEIAKWTVRPYSYGGPNRKLRGQLSYRESY